MIDIKNKQFGYGNMYHNVVSKEPKIQCRHQWGHGITKHLSRFNGYAEKDIEEHCKVCNTKRMRKERYADNRLIVKYQ